MDTDELTPTLRMLIALAERHPFHAHEIVAAIEDEARGLIDECRPSTEIAMYDRAVMDLKKRVDVVLLS